MTKGKIQLLLNKINEIWGDDGDNWAWDIGQIEAILKSELSEYSEHQLIKDDDGHWYVVPADKYNEVLTYFERVGEYWNSMNYDNDPPTEPDYLFPLGGGPREVIFSNYRLR